MNTQDGGPAFPRQHVDSAQRDSCEYNPDEKRAAYENEQHAPAAWIVGHEGNWRLCETCAALPEFRKYRKRKRIVTQQEVEREVASSRQQCPGGHSCCCCNSGCNCGCRDACPVFIGTIRKQLELATDEDKKLGVK